MNAFIRQNTPVETADHDAGRRPRRSGRRRCSARSTATRCASCRWARARAAGWAPAGDTYSLELCGGTHVAAHRRYRRCSGSSRRRASASGVRRIEALTGAGGAGAAASADAAALAEAAGLLKARPEELAERVRALLDERRARRRRSRELRRRAGDGRRAGGGEGAGDGGRGAVPGPDADRRVGQGPARADRRAQGAARVGGDPARGRHRRQGGGGGGRDGRPDRAVLGGGPGPRRRPRRWAARAAAAVRTWRRPGAATRRAHRRRSPLRALCWRSEPCPRDISSPVST